LQIVPDFGSHISGSKGRGEKKVLKFYKSTGRNYFSSSREIKLFLILCQKKKKRERERERKKDRKRNEGEKNKKKKKKPSYMRFHLFTKH
jgi:hypothetical protein